MKFSAKEDFKHGQILFEEGNSYESEKYGLSDTELNFFHGSGWISIEGKQDLDRKPGAASLQPSKLTTKSGVKNG